MALRGVDDALPCLDAVYARRSRYIFNLYAPKELPQELDGYLRKIWKVQNSPSPRKGNPSIAAQTMLIYSSNRYAPEDVPDEMKDGNVYWEPARLRPAACEKIEVSDGG